MNAAQMEDLLRDALQARAEQVTQVATPVPGVPGRSRSPRAWLMPLVAAAAVVALLGAVFVGRSALGGRSDGDQPGPAGTGTAAPVQPVEAPASFLGIRDGALVRYATATGAATVVVAVDPGTTVSSAAIAADGTIYYTIVTINNSASGQLWRIPPGGQPQLMLDPPEWAPRSVTVHDKTLAVEARSRSGAQGSSSDGGIVLISTFDGAQIRRIDGSPANDDELQAIQFLADGRLAVLVTGDGLLRTMRIIDPASAGAYDDGPAVPVDPGWQVSAIASGPDGIVAAFWSGASVEVNLVDPTTFLSTRTLYASTDSEVVTNLSIDALSGAVLAARDRRYGGAPVDAGSVPLVLLDGRATPVPGLEPPPTPPIDVVRIAGWLS